MIKFFWILRAIFYKFFFKKISMLSYIGKPIFLYGVKRITIGRNVRIFPGIRMETHNGGNIVVEDGTAIAQNVHITSGGELLIKKNSTILGNVFITNIDHDYTELNQHVLKQKKKIKTTIIGENCFIGYGASIQAGTILGKQCIVGTNSVVRGIFSDYSVIVGVPGKVIKKYNLETKVWEKVKE